MNVKLDKLEVWTPVYGELYMGAANSVLRPSVEKYFPGVPFHIREYTGDEVDGSIRWPSGWWGRADYVKALITREALAGGAGSVLVLDADAVLTRPLDFYLTHDAAIAMCPIPRGDMVDVEFRRVIQHMGYGDVHHTFGDQSLWASIDCVPLWMDLMPKLADARIATGEESLAQTMLLWNLMWYEMDKQGRGGFFSYGCQDITGLTDQQKRDGRKVNW